MKKLIHTLCVGLVCLFALIANAKEKQTELTPFEIVEINLVDVTNIRPPKELGKIFGLYGSKSITKEGKQTMISLFNNTINVLSKDSLKNKQIDLHVIMRRYNQQSSSAASVATAAIAWAITEKGKKEILYKEEFYAQGYGVLTKTASKVRQDSFKNIVRRILTVISQLEKNNFDANKIDGIKKLQFKTVEDFSNLKWKGTKRGNWVSNWVKINKPFDWDAFFNGTFEQTFSVKKN